MTCTSCGIALDPNDGHGRGMCARCGWQDYAREHRVHERRRQAYAAARARGLSVADARAVSKRLGSTREADDAQLRLDLS